MDENQTRSRMSVVRELNEKKKALEEKELKEKKRIAEKKKKIAAKTRTVERKINEQLGREIRKQLGKEIETYSQVCEQMSQGSNSLSDEEKKVLDIFKHWQKVVKVLKREGTPEELEKVLASQSGWKFVCMDKASDEVMLFYRSLTLRNAEHLLDGIENIKSLLSQR